jgi:hypothetical protein
MILRRLTENLRAQNWTAITIEFLIVVIGVFIGTQVANWNQGRLERQATERMLVQLIPEMRTQMEFFDSAGTYYATTRRYAEQAFAGWDGDPRVSDEQFAIAAYQASQIYGIGINGASWSLTFGGEQLRNIADPKTRRTLEVVMTADYSQVAFNAVATRYREQVRRVIPIDIQDAIRNECGDRNVMGRDGVFFVTLPAACALKIDPARAAEIATALRARRDLVGELRWHLAAVATYLASFEGLSTPIRTLHRDLMSKYGGESV